MEYKELEKKTIALLGALIDSIAEGQIRGYSQGMIKSLTNLLAVISARTKGG